MSVERQKTWDEFLIRLSKTINCALASLSDAVISLDTLLLVINMYLVIPFFLFLIMNHFEFKFE